MAEKNEFRRLKRIKITRDYRTRQKSDQVNASQTLNTTGNTVPSKPSKRIVKN